MTKNQYLYWFMRFLRVPKETALHCLLPLRWKRKRILARHVNCSHTTVNKVFAGEIRTGDAADKIFKALGIKNPWA